VLAIDLYANLLFVASNDSSIVTAVDPKNCRLKRILHVNRPVYGLGVATVDAGLSSDTGNHLWVADSTDLTVFDDVKGTQVKQIPLPGGPRYICIPFEASIDVTTQQGSVVSVDPKTYEVTTLISGGSYGSMDFDENTGEVYVPDQKNNQLVVLAPFYADSIWHQEARRSIPLEARPTSVAVTNDGQLAFVALENGMITMFDIPAHQIINTFDVGGNPHFIITGLNPPPLPPLLTTTPTQAQTPLQVSNLQTNLIIAVSVIIAVLLVVSIILFKRNATAHSDRSTQ